jgi:hypothetical protein
VCVSENVVCYVRVCLYVFLLMLRLLNILGEYIERERERERERAEAYKDYIVLSSISCLILLHKSIFIERQ